MYFVSVIAPRAVAICSLHLSWFHGDDNMYFVSAMVPMPVAVCTLYLIWYIGQWQLCTLYLLSYLGQCEYVLCIYYGT